MPDADDTAAATETWVPWYRVEAGPDGLLIIGQDDESFALDEEDGIEAVVERLNRLWNALKDEAREAQQLRDSIEKAKAQAAGR